jgi:hypothetical protein
MLLNGIRAHDPSVRAGEDSSCIKPHGHCDLLRSILPLIVLFANIRTVTNFQVNGKNEFQITNFDYPPPMHIACLISYNFNTTLL